VEVGAVWGLLKIFLAASKINFLEAKNNDLKAFIITLQNILNMLYYRKTNKKTLKNLHLCLIIIKENKKTFKILHFYAKNNE